MDDEWQLDGQSRKTGTEFLGKEILIRSKPNFATEAETDLKIDACRYL